MFRAFSFEPPRPHSRDVLREVEDILDARGSTFGNLITSALGEKNILAGRCSGDGTSQHTRGALPSL